MLEMRNRCYPHYKIMVSALTLGEISRGVRSCSDPQRRELFCSKCLHNRASRCLSLCGHVLRQSYPGKYRPLRKTEPRREPRRALPVPRISASTTGRSSIRPAGTTGSLITQPACDMNQNLLKLKDS